MASDKVLHVSDSDFDAKIIGSKQVCLVDFWAEWCGPCRSIGPVIEELAADYEGKAVIAKVNVDESPNTPGKFGIRAIPTLIVFKNGQVVDQVTGAVGKKHLQEMIDKAL